MKKMVCSCFFLDGKLCVWDRMFCNLRNYSIMNVVEVCFPVYYHLVLFICLLFLFVSRLLVCFWGVSRRAKNPLVYTAKQIQSYKWKGGILLARIALAMEGRH
jgi:hypothetical protein